MLMLDARVTMQLLAPCVDFMARYYMTVPSLSDAVKATELGSIKS